MKWLAVSLTSLFFICLYESATHFGGSYADRGHCGSVAKDQKLAEPYICSRHTRILDWDLTLEVLLVMVTD